jgi:hypothetical protein
LVNPYYELNASLEYEAIKLVSMLNIPKNMIKPLACPRV